jgi:RNA polymerase sigma-70 factor (ECF subfamily)
VSNQKTQGLTTEQLVALAQATGDRRAFDQLFALYGPRLKSFLRGRAGPGDADDLLQETYIKAFLKIQQFNGNSQFSSWLFSIAINEFLIVKRKQKALARLRAFFKRDAGQDQQAGGALEPLLDLDRLFRRLSANQYDAYVLSKAFGYSHGEIAAELDMPLGSVKTYINQANRLLNE